MATTEHFKDGTGDVNSTFDFTFPYLKQADIVVKVYESGAWATKAVTTHYTFPTATSIKFVTGQVPASGTENIHIYRNTSSDKLAATFYPGSAIRSSDLNDNYTQNLYVTQESENDATMALDNSRVYESGAYVSAITKATTAVSTANTADTNASSAVTTANTASTNATNAVNTANAATTTADAADTKADTAISTANSATTTANAATTTANTADTNATAAVSTANTANTNATTALNNSRESDGSGGYNSAISIANSAKTTATQAQTAVSNALLYTQKDDKTAFEAVTFDDSENHEAWEVSDSTGITSAYNTSGFTDNGGSGTAKTVTGVPADFTGDSGLSARFTYTHGTNTFAWAGYWVNDAETRYVVLGPATGSAPQSQSTTAANLPSGTTAQRPASPVAGMFRYNTTESEFEGYDGSAWGEIGGGLVTIDGGNFNTGTSLVHETESYDGGTFT